MSVETGIAGKTYRTGESFLIDDLAEYEEAERQGSYRSGISLPIDGHGNFQAVAEQSGAFTETDLELAELLIDQTQSALDRLQYERELEQQNDRLDEFASIVSHDLRNPLGVAEGNLELAREDCDSEYLEEVAWAHGRMETLIENLLTVARERDDVTEVAPVDVDVIAERCWRNIDTDEATLLSDTALTIRADDRRIRQLLENLFRNAIDHSGEDVTVTVGVLSEGSGVFVEDDGPGIPDKMRDQVTEFGMSTDEDGTGFGLAIVAQIVNAHEWDLRITDSKTGGARFEIRDVEVVETAQQ